MQAQHGVVVVIVAPHQGLQLQRVRLFFQAGQLRADLLDHFLVVFLPGQFHHRIDIVRGAQQAFIVRQLVLQMAQLLVHPGGTLGIVPELRLVHLLRQLVDLFLHVIDVQGFSRGQDALADSRDVLGVLFKF